MLSALTKPLESLTAADLQELTQRRWPESENVEYKGELHRERPNQPDSWYSGGNISTQAKYKIFKELVAFANTAGGRLFLGVTETRDRPPCADAIQLVPRCCELAERLEQSIISSIDPPLTFFRVIGVQTQGDSGVVVAEVSRSYNGPHRSPDLQCYVRKGTNSVPVGMREIHDIVMRLSRRQDEIQSRLSERRERFRNWVGIGMPFENLRVGFRITALPVGGPLHIERVFNVRDVSRNFDGVRGTWRKDETNSSTKDFPSCVSLSERPVLGGRLGSLLRLAKDQARSGFFGTASLTSGSNGRGTRPRTGQRRSRYFTSTGSSLSLLTRSLLQMSLEERRSLQAANMAFSWSCWERTDRLRSLCSLLRSTTDFTIRLTRRCRPLRSLVPIASVIETR